MSEHLRELHHVGLVVGDLEATIAWYGEHLGFVPTTRYSFPGVKAAFIERGPLRLELFQTEGAEPMAPERKSPKTNVAIGGINHFAIGVDDLDSTIASLVAKGVELVSPAAEVPDGQGDRFAFIHDNERMLIELFQPA